MKRRKKTPLSSLKVSAARIQCALSLIGKGSFRFFFFSFNRFNILHNSNCLYSHARLCRFENIFLLLLLSFSFLLNSILFICYSHTIFIAIVLFCWTNSTLKILVFMTFHMNSEWKKKKRSFICRWSKNLYKVNYAVLSATRISLTAINLLSSVLFLIYSKEKSKIKRINKLQLFEIGKKRIKTEIILIASRQAEKKKIICW